MAFELRELSGSLFRNDKKTADNHPNATGSCLIDGVTYYISAWTKEGAKGKWQSLQFKRKDAKPAERQPEANRGGDPHFDDLDSDLPF